MADVRIKGPRGRVARTALGRIPTTTLVLLMILLQLMDLGGGGEGSAGVRGVLAVVCEPRVRWWDPSVGECVPCRVCADHQVVLRPCQDYMDSVCGTMKELVASTGGDHRHPVYHQLPLDEKYGSGAVVRTRDHHWKEERRKEAGGYQQQRDDGKISPVRTGTEEILWDWQVASLLLAIIGCLLFLLAAACVAINQSRQWRRIEKHFDADMEALSAQLVSHLASMQHLESGPIVLENFDNRRLRKNGHPIEVRCVYLDQLLEEKCTQKAGGQPPTGNLYIEETIDPAKMLHLPPLAAQPHHTAMPPPPPSGRSSPIQHY